MRWKAGWFTIAFVCFAVLQLVGCSSMDDGEGLESEVDRFMGPLVRGEILSGSILVGRDGEVVFEKGYGLADREHDVVVEPETVFRIGSITKTFTAALILRLVEEGDLGLLDTLSAFVPEYPFGSEVTIQELLSHTSGIRDFNSMRGYGRRRVHPQSFDDLVRWFGDVPLLFSPGTNFAYSNTNYVFLARIAKDVSGRSYEDLLRAEILVPLGLNHTGVDTDGLILPGRAQGYVMAQGNLRKSGFQTMSFGLGHGAMYSTVQDLFRWAEGVRTGEILPLDLVREMLTDRGHGYGFGWSVGRENGRRVVFHGGALDGFVSMLKIFPEEGLVVVGLFNMESLLVEEVMERVSALALGEELKPVLVETLPSEACEKMKARQGVFEVDPDLNLRIDVRKCSVFTMETGQPERRAYWLGGDRLFIRESNAVITFRPGKRPGELEALVLEGLLLWTGVRKPPMN